VGKSANSNWFELARHDKEASELGRKPHRHMLLIYSPCGSAINVYGSRGGTMSEYRSCVEG